MDARPPAAGLRVGELGERGLIARIAARLPAPPPWVAVGIGDDAAVVEPVRNELQVITTDSLVEDVHFVRRWTTAEELGRRVLAVNLSDVAAMGGTPRVAVLSLGLPDDTPVADIESLVDGVAALGVESGTVLVGGNVTRSPERLFIDVTVVGSVRRRRVLRRAGARPGDELYVTGRVGMAAAGLEWLRAHDTGEALAFPSAAPLPTDADAREAVRAYRAPTPRLRLGRMAARSRAATACMDLSDGLADAVRQLAEASGVGARLNAAEIPCARDGAIAAHMGDDPVMFAIQGGDDYELLFAVSPKRRRQFLAAARLSRGVAVTRIGVVTSAREIAVETAGGPRPLPVGFTHFEAPSTLR
ncbi:MAG: thiamine-phosphate kinase [Vicinamibacterales bacterium]